MRISSNTSGLGMGRLIMVVTGAILLVGSGCAIDHSVHSDGLDNASFMNLWNTYAHCKLTSELSDIGTDVHKLADAINSRSENRSFVLPLPTKLERFITRPTNRYAVDMRAMASACSLHAGELALDRGRVDLAQEMFSSVILLYPQDDTSYYIVQAKSYLSALERGVDLSLKTP